MNTRSKVLSFLRSIFFAYLLTAILLLGLAFLLYRLHLNENQVNMGIMFIYLASCFLGGFLSGRVLSKRRFLWGLLFGILYFVLLLLLSFCVHHSLNHSFPGLMMSLLICAGGGMLGGMLS